MWQCDKRLYVTMVWQATICDNVTLRQVTICDNATMWQATICDNVTSDYKWQCYIATAVFKASVTHAKIRKLFAPQSQNGVWIHYLAGDRQQLVGLETVSDWRNRCGVCPALWNPAVRTKYNVLVGKWWLHLPPLTLEHFKFEPIPQQVALQNNLEGKKIIRRERW